MTKESPNGHIVLSLDQIMQADDLVTEWVPIPEWAPKDAPNKEAYGLYVRTLNGRERADWQQACVQGNGKNATVNYQLMTVRLVTLAAVDAAGKPMFTSGQAATLRQKSSLILERISDAASRLSGIGEEETAAILGNSMATQDDDSPTG